MSLFDSASLVITPNGVKEDKLYAIKPTDGSGDLVVTRATTATRVNSDGLIEVTPYNLLQQSQTFDNAIWSKTRCSITSNSIISPNGTLTADTLVEDNTANATHPTSQSVTVTASPQTFSIYAKSANRNWLQLQFLSTSNASAFFDLSNGVVGTVGSAATASITSVGNGWYRCIITTTTASGSNTVGIYPASANGTNSYTGNGTASLYIWGAQIVTGTSAKEYFPTTDRLDVPRLDYTNSSCPSILVEPQRTNLALRSDDFSNASWTKTAGVSVTANDQISPDGTQNADKVVFSAYGNNLKQNIAFGATGTYTHSFWAKGTAGQRFVYYDGLGDTTITLTSNWVRYTITKTYTAQTIAMDFNSYGTWNAGTLYLWGAQLEAGSYSTSYIPTVASTVTRNADVISKTGISSLINSEAGTIYYEGSALANNTSARVIELNQSMNTLSNNVYFRYESSSNLIAFSVFSGGVLQCNINYTLPLTQSNNNKMAFVWALNRFEIWVNGSKVAQDTLGNPPVASSLNKIIFYDRNSINYFEGKIKTLAIFKNALSNTELAQLTTI